MAGIKQLAGIRQLVAMEMVENDNDGNTRTNAGREQGDFFIVTR
jgi:hypothetical protein